MISSLALQPSQRLAQMPKLPLTRRIAGLYAMILKAIAMHRVGDRPDRIEPRANKRRPRAQRYLTEPRAIATERLRKAS